MCRGKENTLNKDRNEQGLGGKSGDSGIITG